MKRQFFDELIWLMLVNKDIYFISIGLGWPRTDEMAQLFGNRFIQTEAAEQTALDIAVGLSLSGKIPITYTITPFYYRALETIRTYINHEKLHVIMIGAGVNEEYGKLDGFSHSASDIKNIFDTQKNITQYYPSSVDFMKRFLDIAIQRKEPSFINIHK